MIKEKIGLYVGAAAAAVGLALFLWVSGSMYLDLREARKQLDQANGTITKLREQATADASAITDLKTAINGQNLAIEQWKATAERAEQHASQAAGQVIKAARAKATADKNIAATPGAMNQWINDLLLPSS